MLRTKSLIALTFAWTNVVLGNISRSSICTIPSRRFHYGSTDVSNGKHLPHRNEAITLGAHGDSNHEFAVTAAVKRRIKNHSSPKLDLDEDFDDYRSINSVSTLRRTRKRNEPTKFTERHKENSSESNNESNGSDPTAGLLSATNATDLVESNSTLLHKSALGRGPVSLISSSSITLDPTLLKSLGPAIAVIFIAVVIKSISASTFNNWIRNHLLPRLKNWKKSIRQRISKIKASRKGASTTSVELLHDSGSLADEIKNWKERCLRAERDRLVLEKEYESAQQQISDLTAEVTDLNVSNRYLQSVQRDHEASLQRAVEAMQKDALKERERLKSTMLRVTEKELEIMKSEIESQASELKIQVLAQQQR